MKKPIITISGLPGSGKSTIADHVAHELGWDRFSSGDFMRELAHERGVTLSELSKQAEDNPQIDRLIDAKNQGLAGAEKIVIDSRLAFHFIPQSFKVYLTVDLSEGARRIHGDDKETRHKAGENHDELADTKKHMLQRLESERRRYGELYELDHTDPKHYDLVIDTTDKDIKQITERVVTAYQNQVN